MLCLLTNRRALAPYVCIRVRNRWIQVETAYADAVQGQPESGLLRRLVRFIHATTCFDE